MYKSIRLRVKSELKLYHLDRSAPYFQVYRILQETVAQSRCLGWLIRKLHQQPASTLASEEASQRD